MPRTERIREAWRLAEMVSSLPGAIHTPGNLLLQQAAVEGFFIYVRSLIEFFGLKPRNPRDFSAFDVIPGWQVPTDPARDARLLADWVTGSRHVAHMSKHRVASETQPVSPVPTELANLQRMADDILALWDAFVSELDLAGIPKRADFAQWS
ncbi:hypothetical protein ACWEVD_30545 [Nocardia thailandica]